MNELGITINTSDVTKRKKVLIIEFKNEHVRDSYRGLEVTSELLEVIHVIKPKNEANETLCPLEGMWEVEKIEELKRQLTQ